MEKGLQKEIVRKQLEMLRFRSTFPAFSFESEFTMRSSGTKIFMEWKNGDCVAALDADLGDFSFEITGKTEGTKG